MDQKTIHSHKELIVWQKSRDLAVHVYELSEKFPKEELYGLTSQMRRAAISISSNIAEGRARGTRKDYLQFLRIAQGSCAELETQIEIAQRLPKTKEFSYREVEALLTEVEKMLSVMIRKMNPKALEAIAAKEAI